jgi:hypothetical protein
VPHEDRADDLVSGVAHREGAADERLRAVLPLADEGAVGAQLRERPADRKGLRSPSMSVSAGVWWRRA